MNNQNLHQIARALALHDDAIRRACWHKDMRIQRMCDPSEFWFATMDGVTFFPYAITTSDMLAQDWVFHGSSFGKV